jgi:cytochrome c2
MRPSRARVRKWNDTTPKACCPNSAAPGAGEAARCALCHGKSGPGSGELCTAGIGDHLQRNMGRRKGVIEELALTW